MVGGAFQDAGINNKLPVSLSGKVLTILEVAAFRRAVLTSLEVELGNTSQYTAAAPATSGVAKLFPVPGNTLVAPSALATVTS
jgi:hypothetical protein